MPETTQLETTTQPETTDAIPMESALANAQYPEDNPQIERWMIRAARNPIGRQREWRDANPGLVRLIIDNQFTEWLKVGQYTPPVSPETARKLAEMTEEEIYQLQRKRMESIALAKIPCNNCHQQESAGHVWMNHKGGITGTRVQLQRRCPCAWLRMYIRLRNKYIPPVYRWVDLDRLQPYRKIERTVSLDQQQANINFLRANPELSYLFLGAPGIGKTVYEMALIDKALREYSLWRYNNPDESVEGVWVLNTRTFLDQCQAWQNGAEVAVTDADGITRIQSAPPPELTPDKIRAAKEKDWKPRIFLLELDKFGNATKNRLDHLFHIMDVAQCNDAQMVADTNYKLPQLHHYLEGADGNGGDAEVFTRRFLQADGQGQQWDFFKETFGSVPKLIPKVK